MARPNKDAGDSLDGVNVYGGNDPTTAEEYADQGWQEQYAARKALGYSDEEAQRYADEWLDSDKWYGGDKDAAGRAVAASHGNKSFEVGLAANEWARLGQDVLGMQRGSRAGIDAARDQALATRQARVDLLDIIEGGRGDTVTPASMRSADSLLQQAAAARARGIDPSLAMTASAAAGRDMAGGAMGGRVAEGQGQMAALQEGAYGIRGGDLQRAGLEQQILEGDLAHQQAKEDLYLKYINEAQSLKETGRNAEVQLANIAAGGPASFDWGEALVPAALQAGSLGLLSLGSMGGGSPNQVGTVGHVANPGPAMQQSGYMAPDLDQYLANYKPYGK